MLGIPPQKGHATWKPRTETIEMHVDPGVSKQNQELHRFVLEVTGRYLHCISDANSQAVSFHYDRRDDLAGFLKLDVLYEFLIVGCDTRNGPVTRFRSIVERSYYFTSQADQMEGFGIVPIVTFGELSPYLFYVESGRSFARVHPFFLRAAHRFVAQQIVPAYLENNQSDMLQYVERMKHDGSDPMSLLRREPLIRNLLDATLPTVRTETIKQIAAEIRRNLSVNNDPASH